MRSPAKKRTLGNNGSEGRWFERQPERS